MNSTHEVPVIEVKLEPHPDPETTNLSLVSVFDGGYTVVVRTADWRNGDLAAFVQPDSIVGDNPVFDFLGDKKLIKARKLRGINSFGLLVPAPAGAKLGDNVADILGVTHYDPPTSDEIDVIGFVPKSKSFGKSPSVYIPHYDLENFKKYHKLFEPGEPIWALEKIHGEQGKFKYDAAEGRMYCGSKKCWKDPDPLDNWWRALAQTPQVEEFCRTYPAYTLFGEVAGWQKGYDYGVPKGERRIFGFDIFTPDGWLKPAEAYGLACAHDLLWAPVVLADHPYDFEELLELAESETLVKGANHYSEGLVISPYEERSHPRYGRIKLKIVSMNYLSGKGIKKD